MPHRRQHLYRQHHRSPPARCRSAAAAPPARSAPAPSSTTASWPSIASDAFTVASAISGTGTLNQSAPARYPDRRQHLLRHHHYLRRHPQRRRRRHHRHPRHRRHRQQRHPAGQSDGRDLHARQRHRRDRRTDQDQRRHQHDLILTGNNTYQADDDHGGYPSGRRRRHDRHAGRRRHRHQRRHAGVQPLGRANRGDAISGTGAVTQIGTGTTSLPAPIPTRHDHDFRRHPPGWRRRHVGHAGHRRRCRHVTRTWTEA